MTAVKEFLFSVFSWLLQVYYLIAAATKEMRTGLFFYVIALHLLVFVTTYHWSHAGVGDYQRDNEHLSHLPPSLPVHIQQQLIAQDAAADPGVLKRQ